MAINEIKDADLRKYILGKVPAELADQIDELSFVDEYSELISSVERELVDDYISGRISPDERSAFESHYLSSPIRRERVRFADTFANYKNELSPVAVESPTRTSIFDLFRQRFFILQFGAAALLLMIIGTFAWLVFREQSHEVVQNVPVNPVSQIPLNAENSELTDSPAGSPTAGESAPVVEPRVTPGRPTDAPTPTPTPSKPKERPTSLAIFVLTPALRSSSFQTINIPPDTNSAEFRLRLETEDSGPLAGEVVNLRTQSKVWSSRNALPRKGASGSMASIRIPAHVLKSGEYRITVSQYAEDRKPEKIGDYFFRVAP